MLSSVIPHAAVLKKFFNHKANSPPGPDQSSSTTLAETIEEAFERRFYTTNNSSRINLHDNDLFLLTTAVDPRYRLDFFSDNLRQKVVRILKSQVKNHSCRETGQSGQVPLIPLNKPKAQIPTNDVPKNFLSFYSTFKSEKSKKVNESEQKDSVDQEIETEIKAFLAEENLSAEEVKEAEVLSW